MTAAASLRAALGTGYRHSMRLVLLNCAVGAVAAIAAAGAAYVLPLAFVAIAAGPTDELAWSDAHDGLRLHWRLGLALGALAAAGVSLGVLAIRFYSQHGVWPLSAFAAYVLASFCVWQLVAWPLAVANSISCGARASPTGTMAIPAACNGAARASSGVRGVA